MSITKDDALKYHSEGRRGKIEVIPCKPCFTSRDLSLAYTPGVAEPCREIAVNDNDVFKYTAKGNLVAVVSNGTAVLGLGNIGPHAGKPVMEGKGVLFKRFADIDVFDIELKTLDPNEIIKAVQLLEPTFGGINLEDIKAPECFIIEEELKKTMNIPVFHDDQHGTAIISCAALINACEIVGKNLEDIRLVVVGAGAAGIACSKLYEIAGIKHENICMFDTKGLIHNQRTDLNKYKAYFAIDNIYPDLSAALKGADVFVGLSKADLLTPEMIKVMADNPIVFAMANPDPEIKYEIAKEVRSDLIMATGRSDYPNQVNNVLGFPFIFRGALDVRASSINEEMKLAAVKALAQLAKDKVPDVVINAYGGKEFSFGREYIIPKPFDPRVLWTVAPAVAKAAIDTGVAKVEIYDWKAYEEELKERLGYSQELMRLIAHKAKNTNTKIVFVEGEEEKIIRAAHIVVVDKIGKPILLGNKDIIKNKINELHFNCNEFEIRDPKKCPNHSFYANELYKKRNRKGVTLKEAEELVKQSNYYGSMLVALGEADSLIGGLTSHYPQTIKPALQCVGVKSEGDIVCGLYIVIIKRKIFFFADATVNISPDANTLSKIAITVADTIKTYDIEPKIAMLSFSNFGSVVHPETEKVKEAVRIVKKHRPDIIIDGEMQADTAVVPSILEEDFPFSSLNGAANVLIFPNLSAGNIAYKLFQRLTDSTVIGPVLMGMNKSVHVLQKGASVDDIINIAAIAVVDSLNK